MKKSIILLWVLMSVVSKSFSQSSSRRLDSLFAKGDSTRIIDSLMLDLDAFIDSATAPKSFFSFMVGVGNRTFSVKNNSLNTQSATTKRLAFTPTLGYYHKSGLGLSTTGFLAFIKGKPNFFQFAITPSYDYVSRRISAGLSYTRYFHKDTSIASISPYINDFYTYVNLKRKSWRYGLSMGYANGSFGETISYGDSGRVFDPNTNRLVLRRFTTTMYSNTNIKDFSLSASVRKEWEWYGILKQNDDVSLLLTGYLVWGSSRINTSNNVSYEARKLDLSRFKRTFNTKDGTAFQVLSTAISLSLFYTLGKFSVQPVFFIDYYFPETTKKVNTVFSITAGVSF